MDTSTPTIACTRAEAILQGANSAGPAALAAAHILVGYNGGRLLNDETAAMFFSNADDGTVMVDWVGMFDSIRPASPDDPASVEGWATALIAAGLGSGRALHRFGHLLAQLGDEAALNVLRGFYVASHDGALPVDPLAVPADDTLRLPVLEGMLADLKPPEASR